MTEGDAPDGVEPVALGRSWDSGQEVPFKVWTNYGHGVPHFYVCLDAGEHDESGWWFDPDQAEALGVRLQEFAKLTRQQNVEEEERLQQLPEGGWVDGPPDA